LGDDTQSNYLCLPDYLADRPAPVALPTKEPETASLRITSCEFAIKDSGDRTKYSTGAQRDRRGGKGRYDLLPFYALRRLAIHFEKGAEKYDAHNWRKGIPLSNYFDSALRHASEYREGKTDEDHAIAAAWNMLCLVETEHMISEGTLPKELNDLEYPGRSKAGAASVPLV
jgi:hypothetical protein